METDDLLCSCNARSWKGETGSLAVLLIAERTISMCSFDARNRGSSRLPWKMN
jgi:hypothetical protein